MVNKKKLLFNLIFFICISFLTIYAVFHNINPQDLIELLHKANGMYWMIAVFMVLLFISCESHIIHLLLNKVGKKTKLGRCLLYSFTGFFFSSITPAAGGGQPAQVYFMQKDDIDPGISTPIFVFITICYKSVLVFCGLFIFIFRPYELLSANSIAKWWCLAGLAINVIAVSFFLLLIFFPAVIERAVFLVIRLLSKFINKERINNWQNYLKTSLVNYRGVAKSIRKNKSLFIIIFLISLLQRFILFSITWFVLKSFGINTPLLYTILMQSMVSLGTDLLPLPGGSGANEALFVLLFESLCGKDMVLPVLIASRGISYYGQLIICGIVFFIFITIFNKRGKI